jgi:hypothetical protein
LATSQFERERDIETGMAAVGGIHAASGAGAGALSGTSLA